MNGKRQAEIAASIPKLKQQWPASGQVMQAGAGQTVCGTAMPLIAGLFIKSKK